MIQVLNVDEIMSRANHAFHQYREVAALDRARFLRTIADKIGEKGDALIDAAMQETNLPELRLKSEKIRTIDQLKSFAKLLETGDWIQASIDTRGSKRTPTPKPDLRKMLFPIGPVMIFGASNFPFAFSTAGGDTASALAAGCSVLVKSHPAHPRTSAIAARAIEEAIKECEIPDYVFQHVTEPSFETGQQLVAHSLIKAVTFTGSFQGGKALFDLAQQRKEPIPVFAEMGSINPVVLFPSAIRYNTELPFLLASSILQGIGQFCTNPGLLLVLDNDYLPSFLNELTYKIENAEPGNMLYKGIAKQYRKKKERSLSQSDVEGLAKVVEDPDENMGAPALALTDAHTFIKNDTLKEEVFGPYSLVVKCSNTNEVFEVIDSLHGQLSGSVFGTPEELQSHSQIVNALHQRCGRLIFNGVPTGVEVCKAMHHGGPFPATTDSRFTSVGVDAIYRFVRPVSFQSFPSHVLPDELKDNNPLGILRCINGQWTRKEVLTLTPNTL